MPKMIINIILKIAKKQCENGSFFRKQRMNEPMMHLVSFEMYPFENFFDIFVERRARNKNKKKIMRKSLKTIEICQKLKS